MSIKSRFAWMGLCALLLVALVIVLVPLRPSERERAIARVRAQFEEGQPVRVRHSIPEWLRRQLPAAAIAEVGLHDTVSAERDGWETWFYEQRVYPGGGLPAGAIERALSHSRAKNKDVRGAPGGGGPMWKPIGPMNIPDGQTGTGWSLENDERQQRDADVGAAHRSRSVSGGRRDRDRSDRS